MLIAQQSAWRYFQRPDADHLQVDSSRTALNGVSTQVKLQHRRGRHWRYALLAGTTTPGYEVNDIGVQYRADRVDAQAEVTYVEPRPGPLLRNWHVNGSGRAERNYDGDVIMNRVSAMGAGQTLNYWNLSMQLSWNSGALDDRLTRGGPSSRRPAAVQVNGSVSSDSRKPITFGSGFGLSLDAAGGGGGGAGIGVTLRPSPSWTLSTGPSVNYSRNRAQYLGVRRDESATHTYGARYLFSELRQTAVGLETRFDVTFTPSLSLQVYAQPYIASADFGAPAELSRPGAYEFSVYGSDVGEVEPVKGGVRIYPQGRGGAAAPFVLADRDFSLRSLRGNAVLRWEYRPGSTLFVAWQQNRSSMLQSGAFELGRDAEALFMSRPDNVLVLKLNYWFNP